MDILVLRTRPTYQETKDTEEIKNVEKKINLTNNKLTNFIQWWIERTQNNTDDYIWMTTKRLEENVKKKLPTIDDLSIISL